ncbi:MAG: extracellular solute-binding protein [Treponema sp.]|jgi:raffinose/stachyose/melibiose transport system substrate-binding protein|nr:extracellular solute-binding protein [Treponema sp.]
MKKFLAILLVLMSVGALAFAGGSKASGKITLKVGDNYPDRNSGAGAVIERLNAEFKASHPNVEIVTESYQDQPWQEKVKIYATANQLPDVMKYWAFPNMMNPLIEAGLLETLNKADFANFGYLPGALEGNEFNGVLYGFPTSADLWVLFVNKSLFEKAGVALPASWEDIVESVPKFRAIGITPVATDGLESWPLCELYDNLLQRINGDFGRVDAALKRRAKYTDPDFVQAAAYMQNLIKAGVFNANLTTSDYGDARNQFGQERAAMYMMGSWEMGLAVDPNFSENFHNSLDVIKIPVIRGGKGGVDDLLAWYGGNYIFTKSKNKDLAYEYVKLLGEKLGKYAWEDQAFFPAQKVDPRPQDTLVSKKLLQIAAEAKTTSGTPGLDRSDAVFKEDHQELIRQLCALVITPEEFCRQLDASAERASKQ